MTALSSKPETIVLRAGHHKDTASNAGAVPVHHQTSAYRFDNGGHASRLIGLVELGNIQSRIMNPTCAVFEQRMAA